MTLVSRRQLELTEVLRPGIFDALEAVVLAIRDGASSKRARRRVAAFYKEAGWTGGLRLVSRSCMSRSAYRGALGSSSCLK